MTEVLGTLARCLDVVALGYLIGVPAFVLMSGPAPGEALGRWRHRLALTLPIAALGLAAGAILALVANGASIGGMSPAAAAWDRGLLGGLVVDTYAGGIWSIRAGLVLLLFGAAVAGPAVGRRSGPGFPAAVGSLAAAAALVGLLTSHAAASERAMALLPLHVVHILALAVWVGGLPAWISLVRLAATTRDAVVAEYVAKAVRRFSITAAVCVALLAASGLALASNFIADAGDLLGTRYGLLAVGKLVLLAAALAFANEVRRNFLPKLERGTVAPPICRWAARIVALELACASGIAALGAWLAQTTPAVHDQPQWRLPFRLSWAATWPMWPIPLYLLTGTILLATGAALAWRAVTKRQPEMGVAAATVLMAGMGLSTWSLAVPAFPDTYRRAKVPYLTASIETGRRLFERHCVACHGPGGLGNGAQAARLPKPPANLSEPHTALHTAGDMYWWIGHGIPAGGMPAFGSVLGEEERWDLVNFLRAFSQGFQARILEAEIVPGQPWLCAPNFYIEPPMGAERELKSLREKTNVLLVFHSSDPWENDRLDALAASYRALRDSGLTVVAIQTGGRPPPASLPFPQIGSGASEIWLAYSLLTRTAADRGDANRLGMVRRHVEFLVDRYGYLRARWVAEEDPAGWNDLNRLQRQSRLLAAEPRILAPPDDHVH